MKFKVGDLVTINPKYIGQVPEFDKLWLNKKSRTIAEIRKPYKNEPNPGHSQMIKVVGYEGWISGWWLVKMNNKVVAKNAEVQATA